MEKASLKERFVEFMGRIKFELKNNIVTMILGICTIVPIIIALNIFDGNAVIGLAVFNIKEIHELTDDDDMELERIGMPVDDNDPILKEINDNSDKKIGNGKIAIFVITKPSDRYILIFSKYILFTSICND